MTNSRRDSLIESNQDEEGEEEETEEDDEEVEEIEEEVEEVEEIEEEEEEEEEEEDEESDKDTSQKLEFEGRGEGLSLISSTPERSKSNPESPSKDATGGNFVAYNFSTEIPVASNKKASNASVAAVRSPIQDRRISFEVKGCSKSPGGENEIKVSLEKKIPNDSPRRVKNSYLKTHGSHQSNLSSGNLIGFENTADLQVHDKELDDENMVECVSTIWQSNVVLDKDMQHLGRKKEMKMPEDLSMSSTHLPQRRPRSSTPVASSENLSKKPAVICDFYTRGWCIKGNSCRFLHQKEESNIDLIVACRKDVRDGTGSRGEADRLRISSSQDQLDLSNTESSSKSLWQTQVPLKTYDWESHGSPDSHDDNDIHTGKEYKSPSRRSLEPQNVNERQTSEHFSPGRYLYEGKLQGEMPRMEFLNDSPFSRGYSLMTSLAGSSTSSSLYLNNNNPFSNVKRTEDVVLQNYQRNFQLHGSHDSYGLNGAINSGINCSYQLAPPLSFSSERVNTHKSFEFDEGYHNSRSVSIPQSSSPYHLRSEVENVVLHKVPRNLSASIRQKIGTLENSWEPSMPFRPSFHYALASFSSSGSQYDPLLDSIEHRNSGNIAVDFSSYSTKGDHLSYGNEVPGYIEERTRSSFPQLHEGILDTSTHARVLSGQTTLDAMPSHAAVDGQTSVPKEEKIFTPDRVVGVANVNGSEQHQGDQDRISKESKVMKVFRAALVEFVKELIKPFWREGHLSKDAHKMIVKKVVEKVLGALEGYQIPNNTESINQYLSVSRPKLFKLVEGYVVKYAKP